MRGTSIGGFCRLVAASVLAFAAMTARAKVDELDLGSAPSTGTSAVATQPDRDSRIVHAFACDDEETFLAKYQQAQTTADGWPTAHMMAKAAYGSGRYMPA